MRHTHTNLYATKVLMLCSYGLFQGMSYGDNYIKNYPVQRPLARLWVMLSHWVIAYYGLIRDSRPSRRLICFVQRVFALPPRFSWHREFPQFTPHVYLIMPSSVPRQIKRLHSTVPSPLIVAFALSAEARHLLAHPLRYSGGLCNEAAMFALCYGLMSCSPSTVEDFYVRAFTLLSRLRRASNITIRSTVNCRSRTSSGKTRGLMGCEQKAHNVRQDKVISWG
jgi:hypothetical protein